MKKNISMLLTIVLLWSVAAIPAFAADNQAFIGSYYQEEEGSLNVICSIPDAEEGGTFTVTVADEEVTVADVTNVGDDGVSKTVYCLVDVSGSMKGRMDLAKEVLQQVAASLGEDDNMVIAKLGNQITESGFLSGQEEIQAEIDALEVTHEDTDLYSGIVSSLKFLQQESGVKDMPVLIIISDGYDEQASGVTQTEATSAVTSSGIPVFTVAPILSSDDYEGAKELGSFARASAGGVHFPKSEEGSSTPLSMTGEEIGTQISEYIDAAFVVRVELDGVTKADSYAVTVSYDDGNGKVYKDSVQIASADMVLTEEETTEEVTTEETTTEETTEEITTATEETTASAEPAESGVPLAVWIGIAALAVILILLIVLLVLQSKKKRREKEREEEERKKKEQEEQEKQERLKKEREQAEQLARKQAEERAREQERQRQIAEEKRRKQAAFAKLPKLRIRLTALRQKNTYTAELAKDMEMTFGRDMSADFVLNADDIRLKPVHFTLLWTGGKVYMWDSTADNGTSHNGVVINMLGRVAVEPGDIIRAGGTEYRIWWED